MEMQDDLLSCVGAQDSDTSGYQMSDLGDIEFHWEDPDLNKIAVFRSGKESPFSASTPNDFQMGSRTENPILTEEEPDKENSLALPTSPVS